MGKRTTETEENFRELKHVLIIYPHWHPANLAGVHRPRLIGNFLPEYGWQPIVLTVKEAYFEEVPDPDFYKTFRDHFDVHRVNAFKVSKHRIIGDIGMRAFFQMYIEAKKIIKLNTVDFIWIPIPSFYTAIIGRLLFDKTNVPYGIDYIDPWVRDITNQNNIRAKLSQTLARTLEPYAVKKAALITGVSTPYYQPVLDRNFKTPPVHAGMPYGFDPKDHDIVLKGLKLPWDDQPNCKPWLYAGAFLPNSHLFVQSFFESISALKASGEWDVHIRLYFIGTGAYPAKRITAYAKDYGLEDLVIEYRQRFPFLHVLNFLSRAHRVMLFGSTEKHYTASKTFQCLLSKRPLLAMLHGESSAVKVIQDVKADAYLVAYNEAQTQPEIVATITTVLSHFQNIESWTPELQALDQYSSKQSAKVLAVAMDSVLIA